MIHFLLLQKFARMRLKKHFRLAIIVPGKCDFILTFPLLTPSNLTVGSRWLSLVIFG
jgi:hypothetical protein